MTAEPRRLHRSAILLNGLGALKDVAVPLVVAFVAGVGPGRGGSSALLFGAAGVVIAVAVGYRRWLTTTWWVSSGGVHLRSGLLSTSETVVPQGRIQAIDTSQNPLQRLFGILSVQVQTAGGGSSAEIVLPAVTSAEARELRAAVGLPEPAERETEELRLGAGALLVAALTAPQLGVLLPIVAAAATIGDEVFFEGLRRGWFERLPAGPALVLTGLVVALVAWAISTLGTIVAFAHFTVERDEDRLRIRRGLAQRRVASLPLSRVHAVRIVEGVVRQPFGLASLRLETAGYRGEPAAAQTLFPLLRRRDVDGVLARLVPELAGGPDVLQPPPRRALGRYVLPEAALALTAATALVAAGVGVWSQPLAWPAGAALVLLAVAHGRARFRAAGWGLDGERIVIRGRLLARSTLIARATRLQEHWTSQTPFQRRSGLADFGLAVGSGRRAAIAHLEREVSGRLLRALEPAALARVPAPGAALRTPSTAAAAPMDAA